MKSVKSFIPNAITFLNLNCGVLAVIAALENKLLMAAIWVALGIFFDFFDGLAARLLHVKSELGKQLDSLADVITSGLVPGLVMMQMIRMSIEGDWVLDQHVELTQSIVDAPIILVGLFITMGAAYRLAVFNLDTRQENSFIGLPSPANAILIISLALIVYLEQDSMLMPLIQSTGSLVLVSIISAYLLNSRVELFSLKLKNFSFASNKKLVVFIVLSVLLLVLLHWSAIPLAILVYVLMGNWKLKV